MNGPENASCRDYTSAPRNRQSTAAFLEIVFFSLKSAPVKTNVASVFHATLHSLPFYIRPTLHSLPHRPPWPGRPSEPQWMMRCVKLTRPPAGNGMARMQRRAMPPPPQALYTASSGLACGHHANVHEGLSLLRC